MSGDARAQRGRSALAEEYPASERIGSHNLVYGLIQDFLFREALLLDGDRHLEWMNLLDPAVEYKMPVRSTVYRSDGDGFDAKSFYFDDDYKSLEMRAKRNVQIDTAVDRDPAPRIRRFISNVIIERSAQKGEFSVSSYIFVTRNRFDEAGYDTLSARRADLVRVADGNVALLRRCILIDQATLRVWANVFL